MKERPILFSGPMVRAILDGRKTQTRRALKNQPHGAGSWARRMSQWLFPNICPTIEIKCPYGEVGDRLWMRETHAIVPRTAYALSDGVEQVLHPDDNHDAAVFREGWTRSHPGRWRPSIHMPRWASRITLEITDVRVERLNEISEADAIAEGIEILPSRQYKDYGCRFDGVGFSEPRISFRSLWQSINGCDSWEQNPWVWVIEFKRVA